MYLAVILVCGMSGGEVPFPVVGGCIALQGTYASGVTAVYPDEQVCYDSLDRGLDRVKTMLQPNHYMKTAQCIQIPAGA